MADTGSKRATLSGIEIIRATAAGDFPMPPVAILMGWEGLTVEPGFVRVRYTARDEFKNPVGGVQGGILTAMLDDAMGPAGLTLLDPGYFCPTLELKTSYIRPARERTLIAEGRVVHKTGRYIHVEGKLTNEQGDLIATATGTLAVVKAELEMDGL